MEWNDCCKLVQKYLEDSPLIVLGSGASMPYGLPSMDDLASAIRESDSVKKDENYTNFCSKVQEIGLEGAIDSTDLLPNTIDTIRRIVWKTINKADQEFLKKNSMDAPQELVDLINKVLKPTPNRAAIVTTNYDRLAEYSADCTGATVVTGFEGALIKGLELPSSNLNNRRIYARQRVVDIWKVHGSLDWFLSPGNKAVSFPFTRSIPAKFKPLIIPPGREKYSSTHEEPYRSMISEADKAFLEAKAYLCIGYGFNDEHIQPKLLAQISQGKPIIVLVREMTKSCRTHLVDAGIQKCLVFEREDDTRTRVHGNNCCEVFEGQYWRLENFLKVW